MELGDEADAVGEMIDRAIEEDQRVDWVRNIITLIRFLKTSNASKRCLAIIKHCREYPVVKLFTPVAESMQVEERIEKLVMRHWSLENANDHVRLVRRFNAVRLKEALLGLDPVERRAKARFPSLTSLM